MLLQLYTMLFTFKFASVCEVGNKNQRQQVAIFRLYISNSLAAGLVVKRTGWIQKITRSNPVLYILLLFAFCLSLLPFAFSTDEVLIVLRLRWVCQRITSHETYLCVTNIAIYHIIVRACVRYFVHTVHVQPLLLSMQPLLLSMQPLQHNSRY